ncbi:MAG: hypothetical protein ABEJ70_02355 [Halobacteriaceae archaeon]
MGRLPCPRPLTESGYLLGAAYGAFALLAPRVVVDLWTQLLGACYENPEDLEPKPWVLRAARVEGGLVLAASLAGLALGRAGARRRTDTDEGDA